MIGALVVTILATLVRLMGPLIVRGGVDNGITTGDKSTIIAAGWIFVGVLVVQYVLTAISQWSVAFVGEHYLGRRAVCLCRG